MTATQVLMLEEERRMAKPSIVTEVMAGIQADSNAVSRGKGYTTMMTLSILFTAMSGEFKDINVITKEERVSDHISRTLREMMVSLLHFDGMTEDWIRCVNRLDLAIKGVNIHFHTLQADHKMMGQKDFVTFFDNMGEKLHPNHEAELQRKIIYSHTNGAIIHGGNGFYFPSLEGRVFDMWFIQLDMARHFLMKERGSFKAYGGREEMVSVAKLFCVIEYLGPELPHEMRLEIIMNPADYKNVTHLDRVIEERRGHDRLQRSTARRGEQRIESSLIHRNLIN